MGHWSWLGAIAIEWVAARGGNRAVALECNRNFVDGLIRANVQLLQEVGCKASDVEIECGDAANILKRADEPDAVFLGCPSQVGLRDLGYVEGRNIAIEYRWAEGKYDRLPALAAELVRLNVDVIMTHTAQGVRAAQGATTTIPIVVATVADAVATGLIANLAHPGGNVTGLTFFDPELMAKRLEFLKAVAPLNAQVAILLNPDNPANAPVLRAMETTARVLNVGLQPFEARGPSEFESMFAAITDKQISAYVIQDDPVLINNAKAIADFALRRQLAACGFSEFAAAGGLMAYGVNFNDMFRRAATFVDKILKGAKPHDLPMEQPTRFELVVNLMTAKALGLTVPQSLVSLADEVIE